MLVYYGNIKVSIFIDTKVGNWDDIREVNHSDGVL